LRLWDIDDSQGVMHVTCAVENFTLVNELGDDIFWNLTAKQTIPTISCTATQTIPTISCTATQTIPTMSCTATQTIPTMQGIYPGDSQLKRGERNHRKCILALSRVWNRLPVSRFVTTIPPTVIAAEPSCP
jgi:hypothetical protein